jgi:arylsulfatase A-like enzyme
MVDRAPNIIFILTDQERYLPALPTGYELPGRQRLQDLGVTFRNHSIASNV